MLTLPRRGRRARLVAVIYGVIVFVWLSPEDFTVWPVVVLGGGLAGLTITLWLMGRLGGRTLSARWVTLGGVLWGAAIGLGTSLTAVALMFFKDALHAHLFPDYPPGLMLAILRRAPFWTLAGALAGLGLVLVWLAARGNSAQGAS